MLNNLRALLTRRFRRSPAQLPVKYSALQAAARVRVRAAARPDEFLAARGWLPCGFSTAAPFGGVATTLRGITF